MDYAPNRPAVEWFVEIPVGYSDSGALIYVEPLSSGGTR